MSPLRVVVALLIVTSILGGTHYYLWARLLRDPAFPEPWNTMGKVGVVLLGTVLVGSIALRHAPRAVSSPIAWVAFTWLGLVFFLFIVVDAVRGIVALGARLASLPPEDPARRVALARWLSALVGLGAVGLGGMGFANVMRAQPNDFPRTSARSTGLLSLRSWVQTRSARDPQTGSNPRSLTQPGSAHDSAMGPASVDSETHIVSYHSWDEFPSSGTLPCC
jgi:hypothetical protein